MKRRDFVVKTALISAGTVLMGAQKINATAPIKKIIPKALVKGDLIAITAPAGCIWNDYHIRKIEKILTEMGYKLVIGETNYLQDGYLAGDDSFRAKELMEFYENTQVKAILTMRGGWGCARILDLLDYQIIRENPKIIMGFSDITSLVNAIYLKTGVISFHGPCGYSSWGDFTKSYVTKALANGHPFTMMNSIEDSSAKITLTSGKAKGELVGGNLTVILSLLGTSYEPNWTNSLLFMEETNEEPYRIDRMLWQLKQAGIFNKISGLILGSFNKCDPEEPEKSFGLNDVFEQHFKSIHIPVFQGASLGHLPDKFTLPIGVYSEMDADKLTISTLERSVLQ